MLGCDRAPTPGPVGCPYVLNLALLSPSQPQLHIGDTLTMHVKAWAPVGRECLPPDTTAAGVWWWSEPAEVAIDSTTGHLTAMRPGFGAIFLSERGDDGALGLTDVGVFEPPGADSVVTTVRNFTGDGAWVVLEDAAGAVQRAQTVGARASACFVTPLSDSVHYSVTIRPPPPPAGSDSTMAKWLTHSGLAFNHTWQIVVDSTVVQSVQTVTVGLFALSPDPGKGC